MAKMQKKYIVSFNPCYPHAEPVYEGTAVGKIGTIDDVPYSGEDGFSLTLNCADDSAHSYWHDVALESDGGLFHFVSEIPHHACQKMETMPKTENNPIKQDDKNDLPRYMKLGKYPFNYGMLPQTWESPFDVDPYTGYAGDTDPIDAIEIGGFSLQAGGVYKVKVLGAMAMIDDGETDWKLIVLSEGSDLEYEDITDIPIQDLEDIYWWLINYKSYDCRVDNFGELQFHIDITSAGYTYMNMDEVCGSIYKVDWVNQRDQIDTACTYEDAGITFVDFTGQAYALQTDSDIVNQ